MVNPELFTGLVDYSFRNLRHDPTMPNVPTIVELLGKAFLIESIAGLPDLTMIQVVQHHLNATPAEQAELNKTIAARFHSIHDPLSTLHKLDYVLPRLPTDDMRPERAIGFLVMVLSSIIIVGLRFYVRKFVSPKEIRREDWWCLAALIWSIGLAVTFYMNGEKGGGKHLWTLSLNQAKECAMTLWVSELVYVFAHWFAKFNLIIFYYRLSPNRTYRCCVKLVAFHICNMTVIGMFIVFLQCRPMFWWTAFDSAKCMNSLAAMQAHGSGMIMADFSMLALPMPLVWKLKLRPVEKLLLAAVFALGGVISIITFIRLFALYDWLSSNDWSYDSNCPWHQLEISLSVIVSCAPAIHRLLFHKSAEPTAGKQSKMEWTAGGMFRPTRAAAIRARGRGSSFFRSTYREAGVEDINARNEGRDATRDKLNEQQATIEQVSTDYSQDSSVDLDVEKGVVSRPNAD